MRFLFTLSEDWKARRQTRISRYSKLINKRIVPAVQQGGDFDAKAQRSIQFVHRSVAKWNARGSKKGAGGRIRVRPMYKILGQHSKHYKRIFKSIPANEADMYEGEKLHKLAKIRRVLKNAAKLHKTTTKGQAQIRSHYRAHRAASMLSRQMTKYKIAKTFRTKPGTGMQTQMADKMMGTLRARLLKKSGMLP